MKRVNALAIVLTVLTLLALTAGTSTALGDPPTPFAAYLAGPDVEIDIERHIGHYVVIERSTGHYLVPGTGTIATGTAFVQLVPAGLQYRVMVSDLLNPTEVILWHLVARDGVITKQQIAVLWSGERNNLQGALAAGVLGDADVGGWLADFGVAGLVRAINAGTIYVVVSTEAYGKGEIGGPLLPIPVEKRSHQLTPADEG